MSDIGDDIRDAQGKLRVLAARSLARRQELGQTVARLEAQLASVQAELAALRDAGSAELVTQYEEMVRELGTRLAGLREELALAEQGQSTAQAELAALRTAEGAALRLTVAQATASDPFMPSPEETALANVRGHLAELQSRVALGEELGVGDRDVPPASREPERTGQRTLGPASAPMTEQQARDQLAALKQRMGKGGGEGSRVAGGAGSGEAGGGGGGDRGGEPGGDAGGEPSSGSRRTM